MKHSVYLRLQNLVLFVCIILGPIFSHAVNNRTTYQAKIIKPDGLPLEAVNVNFKFTILDPAASCVLYSEEYTAVNMLGSGGLVFFSLGAGNRTYPVSGGTTLENVLDNSVVSFPCQTPGLYTPTSADNRKIVMQFNDGYGWQTLPAMAINSVPYAMYAGKSDNAVKFNGKSDSAFVEYSSLASLNCQSNEAIKFNGVGFACISVVSSAGISSVTTSGSVLSTGGTASAPVISITAASMSSDGYLTSLDYAEFKAKLDNNATAINSTLGFAPVSSAAVTTMISTAQASQTLAGDVSGNISSNTVDNVGGKSAAQISASVDDTLVATASSTANTIVKRNSSGNFTANDIYANAAKINYADIYKPSTNFSVRLQTANSLSANYVLTLPDTAGSAGQVLSTDGSGNLSWINAATGSVTSVSGTLNEITSSGGVTPTLGLANIGTAGTYYKVTTDNKGRITSGSTTLQLSDLPNTVLNTTSNFAGDISGMISNITVNRIQGVSVTVTSLTTNDILQYDGSKYINKNIPTCSGSQYLTFNGTSFSCAFDAGASGTVASISVTGPISSTGGSNPTLSITQANSTTNGYLSSTDWNTFNNKQNATSAAIIATLGYTPANATSATQWTTSGSNIYYNTGNIGVGVINPSAKLELASGTASVAPLKFTSGTLLTSAQSGTMEYDGFNFYLTDSTNTRRTIATGSSAGTIDNASNINSSGNITMTPVGSVIVSSTTASTNSNTGALVVKGGLGVTGNINTAGNLNVSGSQVVDGSLKLSSMTSGSVLFAGANGTVTQDNSSLYWDGANKRLGIGSNSPAQTLSVSGTSYFSGNVGIGTGSPEAKLDVRSGLKSGNNVLAIFKTTDAQPEQFFIENQGNTGVTLQAGEQFVGNNNLLLNTYGGNVGIGTTNPTALLSVTSSVGLIGIFTSTSASNSQVNFNSSTGKNTNMAFQNAGVDKWYVGNDSSNDRFRLHDSVSEVFTVLRSSGNVGIGTTTPVNRLHVYGNDGTSSLLVEQGNTAQPQWIAVGASNLAAAGATQLEFGVSGGNNQFFSGTTSGDMVVKAYTQASNKSLFLGATATNTAAMVLKPSGSVGIGTTAPSAKLHLAAGTASTASLKFTSGTLLTSAESGTMEYDGSQFYLTDGTNTRRTIATGSSAGTIDNASTINSSGNITMVPVGSVVVSSTTASTNSSTGALVVKGGLGVAGNIYSSGTIITSSNIQGSSITATSGISTNVIQGNTNLLLNPNGGNVGVGTTSPAYLLTVNGATSNAVDPMFKVINSRTPATADWVNGFELNAPNLVNNSYLYFSLGKAASTNNRAAIQYTHAADGSSSNRLEFGFYGADSLLNILASGNVGIGTNSPSVRLDVRGPNGNPANFTSGTISVNGGGTAALLFGTDDTSTGGEYAWIQSHGSRPLFINKAGNNTILNLGSGNVGIGTTTPGSKLQVVGGAIRSDLGTTGPTFIATGTGSNFQVSHDGSANVALFNSGGGIQFRGTDGTTNLVTILSGGNVGIGTSAPLAKLHVNNQADGELVLARLMAMSADGLDNQHLKISGNAASNTIYLDSTGSTAGAIQFRRGGTDSMIIDSTGNVGIGTTAPVEKLQVNGNIRLQDNETNATAKTGRFLLGHYTNAEEPVYVLGSAADASNNYIALGGGNSSYNAATQIDFFTASNNTTTTGTSRMTILPTGNVGIGTVGPATKLDVAGTLGLYGGTLNGDSLERTVIYSDNANHLLFESPTVSGTRLNTYFSNRGYGTGGSRLMINGDSGNVGIGTATPGEKLDVIGNMRIGSSDSNYLAFRGTTGDGAGSYNHTYIGERLYAAGESSELFLFKGNDSDNTSGPDRIRMAGGNILFDTYASPDAPSGAFETVAQSPLISTKMVIKGNGFVGIGTSAPGYTLDVSGTLRITGQAYTNTGNGSFSILSDIRYKDVHGKFDRGLSEILNIDVIKFNYKKNNPLGSDSNREYVGVSAQNLQNFIPEAVESRKVGTEEYLTINTSPVLWTLINAIKQLYKEIEPLKQAEAKIDKLEAENAAKTKEIVALKAYLCSNDPAAAICQ